MYVCVCGFVCVCVVIELLQRFSVDLRMEDAGVPLSVVVDHTEPDNSTVYDGKYCKHSNSHMINSYYLLSNLMGTGSEELTVRSENTCATGRC